MKRFLICLLILAMGMVGCGRIQAQTQPPVQVSPTLQPTTEPTLAPTKTPTIPPTIPPTETPTAQPTLQIQPKAGATFSGPIRIGKDKAASGALSFTISMDGTMITNVVVGFTGFKCESMSASEFSTSSGGEFLITEPWNFTLPKLGKIEGEFTSPTSSRGTISLIIKIEIMNSTMVCDMGTWEWSAEAK